MCSVNRLEIETGEKGKSFRRQILTLSWCMPIIVMLLIGLWAIQPEIDPWLLKLDILIGIEFSNMSHQCQTNTDVLKLSQYRIFLRLPAPAPLYRTAFYTISYRLYCVHKALNYKPAIDICIHSVYHRNTIKFSVRTHSLCISKLLNVHHSMKLFMK